jgi:transcriptional regulator with XRE-family HTH domain
VVSEVPLPDSLPGWVRSVRSRLGLTQESLAESLDVSQPLVSAWEHGVRVMDPDTAHALCGRVGADDRERAAVLALLAAARSRPASAA